ncbi:MULTISPECIES: ferredoxin [unclassified Streptomyces]|uniref:ferredoxin n=1 Tax=unclassified Streptomyces TaxID=2593676 RepID=UPI00202DD7E3|nr:MULTISPECIES: ferredoxin [unclassified Streptomyces]MCM1968950.1 ferredoxin [Streptomyces sp. G1]MCX5125312.1 ferredoxin [Streptomyces sp. NBC_00347]MCX5298870.1 ferredoxin [Streptomyces sp. NBC_00193]
MTYWDPIPAVRDLVGHPLPQWAPGAGPVRRDWSAAAPDGWEKRDWRSVPGPFYTAGTDTCWTGRMCAPAHVMYDDDYGQEFVYRQPRTAAQVRDLVCAGECDPLGAYGGNGDAHWTPELVRGWWRERGRVREWAAALERSWSVSDGPYEREAAGGARAYVAHIDGDLAGYLRGYLFWLEEHRPARPGEALPVL